MADVLISGGYGALPPAPAPESLLCRLDQIDLRLRQLEEQRRGPAAHADDCDVVRRARHQHTKSLPSALQHVRLRGTLMDRLNLLESRIMQLSCELDLDVAGKGALGLGTSSSVPPTEDRARQDKSPAAAVDGSWSAVEIAQKGARQLHRNKPNPSNKAKNLKEAKCACQKKEKKTERSRKTRRWFGVGC